MPNRTDHGRVNFPTNCKLQTVELTRITAMVAADAATRASQLFSSTPYVFTGLAASVTGTGLGIQLAAGEGVDGAGASIYIPASVPNTAVAFSLPAEGTAPQVTLGAANGINPRIDLVCLRAATLQTDYSQVTTYDGTNVTQAVLPQTNMAYFQIVVVPGTPGASPVAPAALLATDLVIAQVLVPATAVTLVVGNVTDVRPLFSGIATVTGVSALVPKNGSPTEAYEAQQCRWTGSTSSDGTTTTTYGAYGQLATIANGATTVTLTRDACGNLTSMTEA
jgi:YD repeat-containing protein